MIVPYNYVHKKNKTMSQENFAVDTVTPAMIKGFNRLYTVVTSVLFLQEKISELAVMIAQLIACFSFMIRTFKISGESSSIRHTMLTELTLGQSYRDYNRFLILICYT